MSKDNKKEVQLQSDLPDKGEEFAHRRRVIRGMASIPVALTLSSGAAMANASSHTCLTNPTGSPQVDCNENDLVPGWLNSSSKIAPSGETKKYCVAYARETDPPGHYIITGYRYKKADNTYTFIDGSGNIVQGGMTGNPLRASCATSFLNP